MLLIIQIILVSILSFYLIWNKKITSGALILGLLNFAALIFFFGNPGFVIFLMVSLLSLIIPKIFNREKKAVKEKRNWQDFIAFSSATLFSVVFYKLNFKSFISLVPYCCALGFIVADIFSSEIRIPALKSKARLISRGFKVVEHGVSGAISIAGLMFGLIGAILVALVYNILEGFNLIAFLTIISVSFLVCFLESVFNDYKNVLKLRVNNEFTNTLFVLIAFFLSGMTLTILA